MTAATNAERQAALKARRKAAGLVPVTVWVHQDWVKYIKMVASGARQLKVDAEAIDNELSAEELLMGAKWVTVAE